MEAKDTWSRHRRKREIIRTRNEKGYNGFDINCSCVCRSCYALFDIFSKYGCLSKNSDGGWIVVLLHGFGHVNSCVHPCLYVLLSQGYRRRNSANPPTFRVFLYLSLQKLVLSNFHSISIPNNPSAFKRLLVRFNLFYSKVKYTSSRSRERISSPFG